MILGGETTKILIETPGAGEEDTIIIRCRDLDHDLLTLIRTIKMSSETLLGYDNDSIHRVSPKDVYYFETVDNHTYLYLKNRVLEFRQKLYQIEETFANSDYLRVSKSVILNITKIKSLSPAFSGRFEAILENGEKVIISRQYVSELKKKLHI